MATAKRELPSDVVEVTITVPVFVGEIIGNDGGLGRIDGTLGRVGARAITRVMLARDKIGEKGLRPWLELRGTTARIDSLREITELISAAVEEAVADNLPRQEA